MMPRESLLIGRSSLAMLTAALLLLCLAPPHGKLLLVQAEKDSNPYPWGENPNNQFKCSVDNYDDDGENRDGGTIM
jgi:hypothetical protein